MKKANQVMRDALADETDEYPAAAAMAVLGKAATDSMAHNSDGPYDTEHPQLPSLQLDIQNLKSMAHQDRPRPNVSGSNSTSRGRRNGLS